MSTARSARPSRTARSAAAPAAGSVATLAARNVTKHHGTAVVLERIDLVVGPETRLGVIGPNGVGKTTLLRVLAGLDEPDQGSVQLTPPAATIGYLAQEREQVPGETVAAFLARKTGVAAAEGALEAAAADLGGDDPDAAERYGVALERYLALGGPDLEARVAGVLADLGLRSDLVDLDVAALSGGQRARVALAALLLSRHDVVLLDEPTNDLDFDGLERLESFLEQRRGGLVVVSHDRAFLSRIVEGTLELDEATHRGRLFAGGWDAYLDARDVARRHAEEAHRVYVTERDRLSARERQQRQWAVSGVKKETKQPKDHDKAQRDFRINRTEKQASKVRQTQQALERLAVVDKPYEGWELHLDLPTAPRSGAVVARLDAAVIERGAWRLGPIDLEVAWGERLGIGGPNGSGKTTLLGALLGTVPLASGERFLGPSVAVGELGQERSRFATTASLLAGFLDATGLELARARSLLAKFGLGTLDVDRPSSTLSPGERTRAELALLMARGTNCLVLDEPTNHLDLPAIEQLEAALGTWDGTLLLVSHDRRLLEAVALTRTLELGRPNLPA